MLETLKLAIVDVETTGPRAAFDRIIEIGLKRVEHGELVATYSTLLDPECPIPPQIEWFTGIRNQDVAGAPTFRAVSDEVRNLLDGCIFVAHNARFDYGFLKHEFERVSIPFTARCLCTVRLSRLLYPRHRRHGLSSLIERFQFACEHRHRALDDAAVVWDFLQHVRANLAAKKVSAAVRSLLETPTLPPSLAPDVVASLPDGPGVYIFYDQTGMPLYVGKSVNIRHRVLSHFAGDHRSGKTMKMCQAAARIETQPTYGELGALLLESHLIKKLSPLYNRMARTSRKLTVARRVPGPLGYDTVQLDWLDAAAAEPSDILAVFRSRRQAKTVLDELARAHRLCPKLLELEHGPGACFWVQLRMCDGACTGREPAALYNARLATAFAARRIRTWPYAGAIVIDEAAPERSRGHVFIIDQWRLVRALAYQDQARSTWLSPDYCFDYDSYKILVGYLRQHAGRVRSLTPAQTAQFSREMEEVAESG